MKTKTIQQPKKRKMIDISEKALDILAIKASLNDKSLKAYIEWIIERAAKISDEELYAFLLKNCPTEPVSEKEKREFETWLNS